MMTNSYQNDSRPALIGYLPPLSGIPKTGANYHYHATFINSGDLVYAHASTMLTSGRNFAAWDYRATAAEANEKYSRVIFFIPCRIAPSPYDDDGYSYEHVTRFVEGLKIPFFSLAESVQCRGYDYDPNLHRSLSPKVVLYLKTIAEKSPVVGTRGYYSAEVLNALGIKNAIPLGCTSLYLNGPSLKPSLLNLPPEKGARVAACYSNYQGNSQTRIHDVLQLCDLSDFHYVEQTFGFVTESLYYPGKISAASIQKAKQIYREFPHLLSLLEKGLVRHFSNYKLWKDFLASMDFAFGARMHGLTPAIHAGIPAMFVAHDARVREMCEFFSLPFVAEHELPNQLNLDFFLNRCDYSMALTRYPERYRQFVEILRLNELNGNISPAGDILDPWEASPDDNVLGEANPGRLFGRDLQILEELIRLSEQVPPDVLENIDKIQKAAHAWYLERRQNSGMIG